MKRIVVEFSELTGAKLDCGGLPLPEVEQLLTTALTGIKRQLDALAVAEVIHATSMRPIDLMRPKG